jgi:hypothetical protein
MKILSGALVSSRLQPADSIPALPVFSKKGHNDGMSESALILPYRYANANSTGSVCAVQGLTMSA